MYSITVSRLAENGGQAVYPSVKEYEINEGMLTLAPERDHDVVIPLFHVTAVDIVKQD